MDDRAITNTILLSLGRIEGRLAGFQEQQEQHTRQIEALEDRADKTYKELEGKLTKSLNEQDGKIVRLSRTDAYIAGAVATVVFLFSVLPQLLRIFGGVQ